MSCKLLNTAGIKPPPSAITIVQVGLHYIIHTLCPFQVDLILIRMKRCDREE